MGISGLLQALAPATRPAHLREYTGRTLVIDGATLLYKAAYISAEEIALGLPPSAWLDASWQYIGRRLEVFRRFGITPVFVLDGRRSPLKRETDAKRSSIRQGYLRDGHAARDQALRLPEGNEQREALMARARDCFQKAVKAPKELVLAVLARLKHCGVETLVAPYEADAQVAYLVRKGYGDGVVTEDSDLITYAALAPTPFPILFKLDATGACVELIYDPGELSMRAGNMGPLIRSLRFMTGPQGGRLFLQASVFAGCDYLASINGVGPISAWEMAVKCRTVPSHNRLTRMVRNLPLKKRRDAPGDYIERSKQAEMLFCYHWVFDPSTGQCVTYLPLRVQALQEQQGGDGGGKEDGNGEMVEGGQNGEGATGGNGNGNNIDEPGPVDKEEEAAAAVRAEKAATSVIVVIDSDDSMDAPPPQPQPQQQRQRAPHVPVLSRPSRAEMGLEALDLPCVESGVDLVAILGEKIDAQHVRGVAEARLHPETLQPLRLPAVPKHQPQPKQEPGQNHHHQQQREQQWRPSSSSSAASSASSYTNNGSGGLPSFLQQQHAERPGASSASASASASFLSPTTNNNSGNSSRHRRPSSSSSSRHEPAGFRAAQAQQEEGDGDEAPRPFREDKEAQEMLALVRTQKQEEARRRQELEEAERARRREGGNRGVKRGLHDDDGGDVEGEGGDGDVDTEEMLEAMSPERQRRVRAAAEAAAAGAGAVMGALSPAFPPSSPEGFCYSVPPTQSASNSPSFAAPGANGRKENVAPPAALLASVPEEEWDTAASYAPQPQQRGVKNPFAVRLSASASASASSPFQPASAGKRGGVGGFIARSFSSSASKAPAATAAAASSSSSSEPPSSAADAIAGEEKGAAGMVIVDDTEAASSGGGSQSKKKRGGILSFLGPKAPAPMPAPAPAPAPLVGGGGGGGGGKGKGKKGGKKEGQKQPVGLKKWFGGASKA